MNKKKKEIIEKKAIRKNRSLLGKPQKLFKEFFPITDTFSLNGKILSVFV